MVPNVGHKVTKHLRSDNAPKGQKLLLIQLGKHRCLLSKSCHLDKLAASSQSIGSQRSSALLTLEGNDSVGEQELLSAARSDCILFAVGHGLG